MPKLSTISIRDLIYAGTHGRTGRENHDEQRFKINIDLNLDIDCAINSDELSDTYDYKNACEAARTVIEDEHHVLIEKIVSRITEKICQDPKIISAEVKLEKLDARDNGVPGISLSAKRNPQEMNDFLKDFDIHHILEKLEKDGAVSIPLLSEDYRKILLEEAETYEYKKQPEIVGPAKVREQISSTQNFKKDSLFYRLKNDFEKMFQSKLEKLSKYPFQEKLSFNEMSLQLYEKNSIGITPHMDSVRAINIICIFILTGEAKVATCADREGNEPKFLDTTPGNLIMLRGSGFKAADTRPFHFVKDVTARRIIFGLRQKVESTP